MVTAGAIVVPLVYAGIAVVALMALPVTIGPDGPETALAGAYIEDPVLGVAQAFEPPGWRTRCSGRWSLVAPVLLLFAASATMLGLSRHVYVLATNRQIPSWLGKLGKRRSTPHVAIAAASVICVGLVLPGDVELLAGVFAFGAMLAISDRAPVDHHACGSPTPIASVPTGSRSTSAWAAPTAAAGDLRRRVLTALGAGRIVVLTAAPSTSAAAGCSSGSSPTSSTGAGSRGSR